MEVLFRQVAEPRKLPIIIFNGELVRQDTVHIVRACAGALQSPSAYMCLVAGIMCAKRLRSLSAPVAAMLQGLTALLESCFAWVQMSRLAGILTHA